MASSIVDEAAKNGNSNLLETIIVISAGLISSFIVGGNYVDGILVAEWVDYFHQGSGVTAWLGTAIIGISSCGGCSVTFHLCSIGPYLANRFPNQVAIVQGLRTASGSSGILAFPFIINYCLKQYGWRGCCLIIGGIASQQCALGLLFRHWSNKPLPKHEENQETLLEQNNGDKTRRFRDLHQLDLFKQKMFVVFMIHIFIIDAASSVIYVHIVSGTRVLLEISPEQARFTLSAIGLSILFACVVVSLITKHPMIDTFTLYMIMNTLLAIQVCVIPFMKGYVAALTVSASIGILMSAHAALHLLMLLELFGSEYLYMSYSYGFFSGGFGYLLGAPVAGWIYDATGNYAISFYFCAGLLILCVLILIPEWIKHIKKPKQTDENTIEPVTPTRGESSKSI